MTEKAILRFKFVFNQQSGAARKSIAPAKSKKFAGAIVQQVGLAYSDSMYASLRDHISSTLERDVLIEIANMASLFNRYIVGAPGGRAGPRGQLGFKAPISAAYRAAGGLPSVGLADITPGWVPRKPSYLTRKRKRVGHQRWFEDLGFLGRRMRKAATWVEAFGPISVKIVRTASYDRGEFAAPGKLLDTGKLGGAMTRFSVARIEVRALTAITPEMIPALLTGSLSSSYPDGRKSGLINLLGQADPELAYRLGGGPHVPYRATTEPFLSFVLTRSIPNAVFNRIERGLGEALTGSAGKTRAKA